MIAVVAGVVIVPQLLQCRCPLIVVRGEASCQLVELCRLVYGKALARGCTARQEGQPGAAADLGQLVAGIRPSELCALTEGGAIVLGDELRELLGAVTAQLGQPGTDRRVGAAPAGNRQTGVRHVTDEGVLERVLDVLAKGRCRPHQDEASALEAVQLG